ncbi:hypothetical protein [Streptomyces sp. NPDC059874]|uniref:hypothetical protein n=1 Tax=Streptomyces sp. NPDC059874 TaxID=3346983 RepID=UPI00365B59DC
MSGVAEGVGVDVAYILGDAVVTAGAGVCELKLQDGEGEADGAAAAVFAESPVAAMVTSTVPPMTSAVAATPVTTFADVGHFLGGCGGPAGAGHAGGAGHSG